MTDLRRRVQDAIENAAWTHPCSCGSTIWASCWHADERKLGSHSARRAAAVMDVVQPELDRLTAEIAALQARLGE